MRPFPLRWLLLLVLLSGKVVASAQPASGVLDPFHLYEIRIKTPDRNWENRLKAYRATERRDKIPTTVWIDGVRVDSVGIRFKGNSSFNSVRKKGDRKLPFSLDANDFVKGQSFPQGFRNLKLSNGFRDPSYLRDVLSYHIARQVMPAPQSAFAKVWVNDEYYGVYTLTQDLDKGFLQTWLGERNGPFFKCDPEWQQKPLTHCPPSDQCSLEDIGADPACYAQWYEMKSDAGWPALISMVRRLNRLSPPVDSLLDVDKALWMLAFNNLLVNLDSYSGRLCHNYFLYQRSDSLFVPLIWDLNLSFGGFRMADKTNLSNDEMVMLSPLLHYQNPRRPLIRNLLEIPLYRKLYLAHMETIADEFFRNGQYKDWIAKWQKLLDQAVKEEKMALYPYTDFRANAQQTVRIGDAPVVGIQELMEARVKWLAQHPLYQKEAPHLEPLPVVADSAGLTLSCRTRSNQQTYAMWRSGHEQGFQRLSMTPAGLPDATGHTTWTCFLPETESEVHYYFIAENEHRVRVYPRRASAAPLRFPNP